MGLTRPKYSNIVDTDYKQSVRVVTTTNITLSGGAPSTYDGVTLIAGDRILVNAQSTGNQNGIYTVSVVGSGSNGTWARAFDASINERVTAGMRTFIAEGTYAGTEYRLVTPDPITLGTTSLSFQSTAATVSGTNQAVQYNNAGFIAGAASLVYDNVTGNVVAAATTTSTSPTTGALVVSGGAGVAGNINVGGNIVATGVGLSSFAGSMSVAGVATFNSNVVIVGNLTTLGNTFITNSTDLSIQDSIINLHSPSDLTPLVTNDGKDIGLKLHYYDTVDSAAFIGRDNATGYLVWEDRGTDVAGIFTGTSFGTFKTGNIILTGNTYRGSTNNLTNALLYKASSTAPTSLLVGDQWYDTSTDTLYEWFTDGVSSFWVDKLSQPVAISFASQTTAPTGGKPGDYWYDTSTDTLYTYVYDGLSYNWVDFSSKQPAPVTSTSATAGTTNLSTSVSGVLGVPYGGTGSVNFTSGNLLVGAGTSAITASTLKVDPIYGNLVITATSISTSTTTGALVVKGGAGIAGNVYTSGNIGVGGNTNYYNSLGPGRAVSVVASAGTAYLEAIGGSGDVGLINFGNTNILHAQINSTTDRALEFWINTGGFTNAVTYALRLDNKLNATFANNITVTGDVYSTGNHIIGSNTRVVPTIYYSNSATAQYSALLVQRAGNELWLAGANPSENYVIRNNATLDAITVANVTGNVIVSSTTVSANNTSGALVVKGGVGVTGNLNLTYNPTSAVGSAIQVTGKDTQGGTGWFDFLKATNTTSGATNPSKTLRLNSTGGIEIINNAYTVTLMSLSDAGAMSVSGSYQVSGKKAVNGPAFSAYADATLQTITSGSQQKVLFQVEDFDTDSCFASSRFTPNVEGYYQLNAEVRLDGSSGTGEIMIVLYKNTSEHKRGTNQSGTSIATNFFAMQVSALVYANGTTDYFEIKVQQTSGGSMTVTAVNNPAITWFNGAMVRGA